MDDTRLRRIVRNASMIALSECVASPPPEHINDLAEKAAESRRRAIDTGDPIDDAVCLQAACEIEEYLTDHYRAEMEKAISARMSGARPSKTPELHASEALDAIRDLAGTDEPWSDGDELADDDAFRRYLDLRMILDHHSLKDAETAATHAAEIVDGLHARVETRDVETRDATDESAAVSNEWDYKPPTRRS